MAEEKCTAEEAIVAAVGLSEDVAERELARKALQESEQKYRDLAEFLPEVVFEADLSGRVTFVNRRGYELFGYTPQELQQGIDIMDVLVPEDRDRAAQEIHKLLGGGTPGANEYTLRRKNGSTFPAVASVIPVIREGKPVGFRGIVSDITQVKQYETALSESENKFKGLTERSAVGVYLIQDGLFRYVNPSLARMHGFTVEELVDKMGPQDLVLKEDWPFFEDWIRRTADAKEKTLIKFRGKTESGKIIECEAYGSQTYYREKPAAIGTVLDVTERKRMDEQILALNSLVSGLTRATDLREALEVCLAITLRTSGMKGGAGYAVSAETGDLELVCTKGSAQGFLRVVAIRKAQGGAMRKIMQGKPVYGRSDEIGGVAGLLHVNERERRLAILPILCEGNLIACLAMISRDSEALPLSTLSVLETMAGQIKEGIVRIWAEKAARNMGAKYWALIDGAPDAILLGDTDGTILEANRKAEEIFGYDKGELIGDNFFRLLRPAAHRKARAALSLLTKTKATGPGDTWITRKDRTRVPVAVTASVVEFGGRRLIQGIFRDITQSKQAERALRQSEEKYRVLMGNAGDAIILVGTDGNIMEANRKAVQLLGYAPEELQGMHYSRLYAGVESEKIVGRSKNSSGGSLEDTLATRKDGIAVPVDLVWSRIVIRGTPIIQVTLRDISRRKQAEEALKESEARYRTVFENTGTAMVIREKDMTISFVNSQFERMSGFSRTEIEGEKTWADFIHEGAQQQGCAPVRYINSVDRTISLRSVPTARPQTFRAVISGKTGTETHILVSIAALPGSGRSVASLIDISSLVYAEEVLKQSEERYRALVQQSSEGIFIVDPRTKKILEVNEPFMNMLGYETDEIKDLFLYDLIMETKSFIDNSVGKAMQNGRYFMGERNFRGKNGVIVDVDVAASSVSYRNSVFIMMSFRDVTEKKQMEGALRQAQKMDAIGTLAGGIAHDFNNMLQVIAGCAYQLRKKLKERDNDPLAALAEQILSSSEKASQLTQSILTFSRKQPIDPKPIDINSSIRSFEKFLKRIIGEDIELVLEYSPDSLLVMADKVQIEQVLMNIAANARDAMSGGGVLRISASVEEMGELFVKSRGYGIPGTYACVSVSDTGRGMDEETKRRIFEPFYTTKQLGKGTGLGMAVVYGIVKQHKGFIDVESQAGIGTTIKVYFPLAAIAHREADAVEESGLAAGGTETILLAEDEKDVRAFLKGVLEEAGYKIIEAEDGEDAVEAYTAHEQEIDLALIDVVMPKKDGKQVYDEIRKANRNIKAIFMSGYTEDTIHRKGILRTANALLSKPVQPALLLSKIREALQS